MTFLVPFDGSDLAEAALVRAGEYADALGESVVAVTIVPARKGYAREKGWVGPDGEFDPQAVIEDFERRVNALVPTASYEAELIEEFPPPASISDRIEAFAERYDAGVVFLGSDNVGRIVTPLSSVGVNVAADPGYDVYLVRHSSPSKLDSLASDSDFYDG